MIKISSYYRIDGAVWNKEGRMACEKCGYEFIDDIQTEYRGTSQLPEMYYNHYTCKKCGNHIDAVVKKREFCM